MPTRTKFSLFRWPALVAVSLLVCAAIGVVAADRAKARPEEGRVEVVATTSMIGDAVERIAGDRAVVRTLMGEGVDPHLYRQTQADIAAMVRSDIVFWNGLYLEAQLEEFLERLARQKKVVALAESVPLEDRLANADYDDRFDPHVWMDPTLWRHVVEAARDALVEIDPAGAAHYAANADAYLSEIDAIAAYAETNLASVPAERRILITAHDAFGYFGKAYGFDVLGIQGLSTESEAGLQQINRLVDRIVERDVTSIFVESSVSERNIRALVEGAAARGHEVSIGGQLFSDAMGPSGSYQGTYLGMIDSNATTISRALGGTAPESGMNGRLADS
jgi:manganese/zinc/iron transport system substrate-binding protein